MTTVTPRPKKKRRKKRFQPTEAELLWRHIARDENGCWIWTGCIAWNGYGQLRRHETGHERAHRAVYKLIVGPIPEGLDLDHLCRVRACCNPSHLEPVTRSENLKRSPIAGRPRQTHCKRGHEFTPDNSYVKGDGCRRCRACERDRKR